LAADLEKREPVPIPSQEKEATMNVDPEDARKYLEGVDYPANKQELASTAEGNGAPEDLVEMIRTLDRPEFFGPEEVVAELRAFPGAG
jgi:hypothetical protein